MRIILSNNSILPSFEKTKCTAAVDDKIPHAKERGCARARTSIRLWHRRWRQSISSSRRAKGWLASGVNSIWSLRDPLETTLLERCIFHVSLSLTHSLVKQKRLARFIIHWCHAHLLNASSVFEWEFLTIDEERLFLSRRKFKFPFLTMKGIGCIL